MYICIICRCLKEQLNNILVNQENQCLGEVHLSVSAVAFSDKGPFEKV